MVAVEFLNVSLIALAGDKYLKSRAAFSVTSMPMWLVDVYQSVVLLVGDQSKAGLQ